MKYHRSYIFVIAVLLILPRSSPTWAMGGEDFLALCAENTPGSGQAIRAAIAGGANVNYSGPKGLSPLMVFVGSHNDQSLEAAGTLKAFLAAGADINARSEDGTTALSYAVVNKAGPSLISILLRHGADPNLGVVSRGGLTPLMIAASVEPDPLVSALLLAAGARIDVVASHGGQSATLAELAGRNPSPKVAAFLESVIARGGVREEGLPLFFDLPADHDLRLRIKNLDRSIRSQIGRDNWLAWLAYIKWQTEIDASIDLRRSVLGNKIFEAWINEYVYYLEALEENAARSALAVKADALETKLVFQGYWGSPFLSGAWSIAGRRVIVLEDLAESRVVGYAGDSGRELWRYAPSALSGVVLIKSSAGGEFLLVASNWGGNFGDVALLDAENGVAVLELPALDNPRWALSSDGLTLAVSTDYSLNLFNLQTKQRSVRDWFDLLEIHSWPEAQAEARGGQNVLLAPLGLSLDERGLFPQNNFLFQTAFQPDTLMLKQSRQALAGHNYTNLEVLAIDGRSSGDHNFVLGPLCPEVCRAEDASTPLFLVNKKENLVDGLSVEGRVLKASDLVWSDDGAGRKRPQIMFSPDGELLALLSGNGDLHFFASRAGGGHLGSISAETMAGAETGLRLKDLRLSAILDGEAAKPLCALTPLNNKGSPLILEFDLPNKSLAEAFRPEPGRLKELVAFAAYEDTLWAAALADGELWLIAPKSGTLEKLKVPAGLHWEALAFSSDGAVLAAAESGGNLLIHQPGRELSRLPLMVRKIRHLALNQDGTSAWAAADEHIQNDQAAGPVLVMADLSGRSQPVYHPLQGRPLSLQFNVQANFVVAVEDLPPPERPGLEGRAMKASRWGQGRTDIIQFDHFKAGGDGSLGGYDRQKQFIGLSPDNSTLLFQEVKPAQAFVNLGKESVSSRETTELEASAYQARIGRAAFSPKGRLALLAEAGSASGQRPSRFKTGGGFYLYDVLSGREISSMSDRRLHPQGVTAASFINDGSRAVTAGRDGTIRLWDLSRVKPLNILTWALMENNQWLIIDKDGRFDAPNLHQLGGAHWLSAGRPISLESFLRDFYQPRLSGFVLSPNSLTPITPVESRSFFQPLVKIIKIEPRKDKPGRMSVTVEVETMENGKANLPREVRLYRNDTLVGLRPEPGGAGLSSVGGFVRVVFDDVALPVEKTTAFFKAEAVNSDGLASRPAQASIKYKLKGDLKPRLFLTALNVDRFTNPAWNLNLNGESAETFAAAGRSVFKGESLLQVLSAASLYPARDNIKKAVGSLAQARVDDLILLSISSRGFTANGLFHFLPADISGQGLEVTPELLKESISTEDLAQWLAGLEAEDGVLIIESIFPEGVSAQELQAFEPGPSGDRILALLAYDKGLKLLCLKNSDHEARLWIRSLVDSAGMASQFGTWLKQGLISLAETPGARLFDHDRS